MAYKSNRGKAVDLLDKLRINGVPDSALVEYVIYNYMSGDDAFDALETWARENDCESLLKGEGEEQEDEEEDPE